MLNHNTCLFWRRAKPDFLFKYDEWGRIVVKIAGKNPERNVWYPLFDEYGDVNKQLPKTITKYLGQRAGKIVEDYDDEITNREESLTKKSERQKFLEDKPNKTIEENIELQNLDREIPEERNEIDNRARERERVWKGMRLRDKIKYIFKKYGFTVFAVVSSVGVVIGVIVSNLSKGLTKLGKGVGDGLKTIGKKLGEILPGMVGAIVSFLFKTAGEVIGFLGKNAWLLIVAVVLYFVEQFKKKRK